MARKPAPRFVVVCYLNGEAPEILRTFKPKTEAAATKERNAWQAHADAHRAFMEARGRSYHYAVEPVNG